MSRPPSMESAREAGARPVHPNLRLLPDPYIPNHVPRRPVPLPAADPPQPPFAAATLLLAGAGLLAARFLLRRHKARQVLEAARSRAFADLLTAVRQRDDALAQAAHDLKTPLTALKGQAQLLQRFLRATDGPEAERLRVGLAAIDAAATAAAARIDRLAEEAERRPPDGS